MPIVTNREAVLGLYREAAEHRWVLPCFCTENLTTIEAVLAATRDHADATGQPDLPVILAITNQYDHRAQSRYYTHTRRWDIGLKLFLSELQVLTAPGTPYESLRVMVHLDHTQFDDDAELLSWDFSPFSSIMFDASKVPLDQNIALTQEFVKKHGHQIVVEGACDEIVDATGTQVSVLTTADRAENYHRETKVDLVVANLGTEHRASGTDLHYYGENARGIADRIGPRIVLHGTSSVGNDQLAHLFDDGVCKVNIWTALERDSAPVLFRDMVRNAALVIGGNAVADLQKEGLLGDRCSAEAKPSLSHFTTEYRQGIVFEEMKKMVRTYLELWYR